MINSVLHHLGIGLRDPEEAERFFDRLLVEFLHLKKGVTSEAVAEIYREHYVAEGRG